MSYNFRLLAFNAYDEKRGGYTDDPTQQENKNFVVQMFGVNEIGKTASIFVEGYEPFFYVKVNDNWTEEENACLKSQIQADIGEYHGASVSATKLIKRKKLYEFDGGKDHTFVHVKFKNEAAMKRAKALWYINEAKPDSSDSSGEESSKKKEGSLPPPTEFKRLLNPAGYLCAGTSTLLYEAQIPPLLRLFHMKEISPSGWIALPYEKTKKKLQTTTSCTYEFTINYKHIVPLPEKETLVPFKICSFDIEASSSHGDFPLPVKNYRKLATNIVDLFIDAEPDQRTLAYLKNIVLTGFFGKKADAEGTFIDNVDLVYPIKPYDSAQIAGLFNRWVTIRPATHKGETGVADIMAAEDTGEIVDIIDNDEDNEEGENTELGETQVEEAGAGAGAGGLLNWSHFKPKPKPYRKRGVILDLLTDDEANRDTKIVELTRTMTNTFPKLQGDKVTFIGSTFLRSGEAKPYMNHCVVLDTCNEVPGAVIESVKTEKEVLLAWARLIQKEDPDIVIGYNIFGFDYQFMFLRAKELECERAFLKLARNKKEICLSKNWKTGKEGLEESTLVIASGQHDLKFAKMTGRLQVDLYNYFRRDYQLSQYKLDYVSGYFIGDGVEKMVYNRETNMTKVYSKNLMGLEDGNFVSFEEEAHSADSYKNGQKFTVLAVDLAAGTFEIQGNEQPDFIKKKVKWGLAKDDVTPQDIFRMTNEGPAERAIIAKYCIQDCNLVQHLMRKIDVLTGYVEMANLCSVPLDFLVMRGQGIKLTSYIAKKCREKGTLMPVLDKADSDEGYEGAIVLPPKCNLYLDEPVACVDYSSLYPSSMISENISHDSKVLTREYDLQGGLINETGEKDKRTGAYIYDNLPNYEYVDITYDTYKWQRKNGNPKAGMEKVKVGYKTCRFAQFPDNKKAIMPAILEELLAARKATRKQIETQTDEFMKNILDKRQLSIKVTANSMYGQTGAKTSSFYEKDCAASTTAVGRKLLTYAQRVIEEAYADQTIETSKHGLVKTNAEYVYGDTDSVFFKFNLQDMEGAPIIGQKALEITIELAQQAGNLATMFLKQPHDLEYEKTFLPFCLLSKKRYVGMLYEKNPLKGKRKSMGIVLKRRDNAPIVKDIYGGLIDILMKEKNVEQAVAFLKTCLQNIVAEKYGMDKLVITKALRSDYKKPKEIAHKVLADRIGKRDSGNKPSVGDRIPFVYIENPDKKVLQGDRIETPEYILANPKVKINYSHYITNQIMKPVQQLFALVLEQMMDFQKKRGRSLNSWKRELKALRAKYPDLEEYKKKEDALRNKEVKALLFDTYLRDADNLKKGNQNIGAFFKLAAQRKL